MADRRTNPDDDALRVLVVDDEESMRHFLVRALERQGCEVTVVGNGSEALEALAAGAFDVMVTDIRMPGMDGRELFAKARECAPGTLTVLMTAYGSIKDAIAALEQGAESYLAKPFETDEFLATVTKAGEKARLLAENRVLREQLSNAGSFAGLVGQSSAMRKLYRTIDRVARVEG
ncbi:MAG: sigma-54-dependent Fis family transcriptional regulator, partial [Planctomycetes bacterium]|nr:sigma-54-dependent Fis family transcriptional regulator [Planctomycetota bacterium]